jgi:hypothetical protein
MRRRLREEALQDLIEAAGWYDQRRPGLGQRFLEGVELARSRIEENPRLYRPLYRDRFRRRAGSLRLDELL